jgi:glycosyltransferase involved in cell wall biosynthesis
MNLSIIVPIYNEEGHLLKMAMDLSDAVGRIVDDRNWQFILVDNGSVDGSKREIEEILSLWPSSQSIYLNKPDYGEALKTGLENAQGEWAFVVNVDFYDPIFLAWAWSCRDYYDIILGSKVSDSALDKRTMYRKILSWGLNMILRKILGFVGSDTHGQKFLNLETLLPIINTCVLRRGQFDTELMLRAQRLGFKTAEFPVPIEETRPQRNLMVQKIMRNFIDLWRLRQIMKDVPFNGPVSHTCHSRGN